MTTPAPSPGVGRRLIVVAIAAALAGALLTFSFAYADHSPRPHGVRVAVVAPPPVAGRVAHGLDAALPGGFTVVRSASAAAATQALRTQRARGALVLGPGGDAQVLTAGAAGPTLQQAVQTALSRAATAAGRRPVPRDVVPLPSADRSGLSTFVLGLGLLVPAVVGSVGIYLIGRRARLWWRAGAAALFAVLAAGFGTLIIGPGFGALTGAWPAMFALAALGALTIALSTAALQATIGLPGTGLAALGFIFVGNAVSGGSVPTGMLPSGYRQVSPWVPNAAIVHSVRSVVYFGGHGLGQPLLALSLWSGAALLVLLGVDALHVRARREAPERAPEIHATPGAVHAARAWRGRGRGRATAARTAA